MPKNLSKHKDLQKTIDVILEEISLRIKSGDPIYQVINDMVARLRKAYADSKDKGDILVPFRESCVKKKEPISSPSKGWAHYSINYFFPQNLTPTEHNEFSSYSTKARIKEGTMFDRLGGPYGSYVSPLDDVNNVFTPAERALPYYFMEKRTKDEPSYHVYRAKKDFDFIEARARIALQEMDEESRKMASEDELKAYFQCEQSQPDGFVIGDVAPVAAFVEQGKGGGKQVSFGICIQDLVNCGLLEEVSYGR